MASVEKFSKSSIVNQLRHIERTIQNPSNPDINREKSNQNYSLVHRNISSYDYYKERISQCYLYNREDIKTAFGWVVTCPKDLPEDQIDLFFYNVHDFLNERYGEENCIQSIVHKDESGSPHIHWIGIPVVEDKKHEQGIKVCCNDVINRKDLRNFHDDLDRYLKNNGLNCSVKTGITKAQGGNRTVGEMKQEREMQRSRTIERRW